MRKALGFSGPKKMRECEARSSRSIAAPSATIIPYLALDVTLTPTNKPIRGAFSHWTQHSSFFLVILGVASSCLAWLIDEGAVAVSHFFWAVSIKFVDFPWEFRYAIWVAGRVSVVALAVTATNLIGPMACGSGIPEMRTILGGFDWGLKQGFLGIHTGIAKVVGLTLGLGSGLDIGKEGPFVHTSCIRHILPA